MIDAARRSAFVAKIVEVEMKLLLGIIAGASGVGFALVVGAEVLEYVVEHRKDFPAWYHAVKVFLEVRHYLKAYAPTLYDKLFDSVLTKFWADTKSKIPDAATPEVIAFLVGVILGHLGEAASKGPVAPIAIVLILIEAVVKRFFISVLPGAASLTAKDYEDLANGIIQRLQQNGIHLTKDDMFRIFEEVQRHPKEIKEAYRRLSDAFQQLSRARD